jgi:alanyl-tRNA synthetase
MNASELRTKYLKFFESKGHTIIPSASLVPENDPSVLFTTAGMQPLVPYLMGEQHPGGKRVVNVQKCIRTVDIDEVGDAIHYTFFEMLGNWSLGDYFKEESIKMSWKFLTSPEWLGLNKNRIAISVFAGDSDSPFDEEAYTAWKSLGISEKLIAKLPKENNWWGMEKGPCGPDTEIFYWTGDPNKTPKSFNDDNSLWVEIWNNVFLQYDKKADGTLITLKQKNVDTGMGMERILSAVNGFDDNYKTELFWPIIEKIEEISGKKYADYKKEFRIIADHIKAGVFIISDGVTFLNVGRGYILRRLIRRAIRNGKLLGIDKNFTKQIAETVIDIYKDFYPELKENKNKIFEELEKEEKKAGKVLSKEEGIKALRRIFGLAKENTNIDPKNLPKGMILKGDKVRIHGSIIFNIYQQYGIPIEVSQEIMHDWGIEFDEQTMMEANKALVEHQDLSRTASTGMFKGGLQDTSEETIKLHTVAHLMLAALREVLGVHVIQKGSNITAQRLRFDFSHPQKMTPEQIDKVEELVNAAIKSKLDVVREEMSLEKARFKGAMGIFDSKYGDKVSIYSIANEKSKVVSCEICGGPHVKNTGELGHFKIIKEESSSAGVRRIKAILQ